MGWGYGVGGLVLLGLAVLMYLAAKPRHGEVVGFLRGSGNAQALYALTLVSLLAVGSLMTIFGIVQISN